MEGRQSDALFAMAIMATGASSSRRSIAILRGPQTSVGDGRAFADSRECAGSTSPHSCRPITIDSLYIDALRISIGGTGGARLHPERLLAQLPRMPNGRVRSAIPITTRAGNGKAGRRTMSIPGRYCLQSRFGRAQCWNRRRRRARAYPANGVKRIAIAAPGFSADCLETLEELGIRGRETFLDAGGTHFGRLDCLNDSDEGMGMLDALIRRELAGWWPAP